MQSYGGFSLNHNYSMIFFSFCCDNLPYLRQTMKSHSISVAKGIKNSIYAATSPRIAGFILISPALLERLSNGF